MKLISFSTRSDLSVGTVVAAAASDTWGCVTPLLRLNASTRGWLTSANWATGESVLQRFCVWEAGVESMHRRHPVKQASLLLRRSEMKLLKRIFLITPVRHSQTHMLFPRWLFSLSSLWETTVRPATCFLPHKPEIQQPGSAVSLLIMTVWKWRPRRCTVDTTARRCLIYDKLEWLEWWSSQLISALRCN